MKYKTKKEKETIQKPKNCFKHPPAWISETQFRNPVIQYHPIFHNYLFTSLIFFHIISLSYLIHNSRVILTLHFRIFQKK